MCSVLYLLSGQNPCIVQGTAEDKTGSKLFKASYASCSHILFFRFHPTDYVSQSHSMHPGVSSFHTRVRSSSSQTTTRQLDALRGHFFPHPGALLLVVLNSGVLRTKPFRNLLPKHFYLNQIQSGAEKSAK